MTPELVAVAQRRTAALTAMYPSKAMQSYDQLSPANQRRVDRVVELGMQEACAAVLATAESIPITVRPGGDLMRGCCRLLTVLETVDEIPVHDDAPDRARVLWWVRTHWHHVATVDASRVLAAHTTDRGTLRLAVHTVAEETY